MDIRVQATKQSEASLESFGSYSAQISTPSTVGQSLTNVGKTLNSIKQKKQKESDLLTSDRLFSDWSADFTIAVNKLKSKDINEVKQGQEEAAALDPDSLDFEAYGSSKNLAPLYDENSFAKYKNRARQLWEVENALAGSREADRHRATGIKNNVNAYSQTFSDNLDMSRGYDTDLLKSQIDYFSSERFQATVEAGGEGLASSIYQGHTEPLIAALKHQLNSAMTPQEYEDALEVLEYANESIPAEMYKDELTDTLGATVRAAEKRVNDPNSIAGLLKVQANDISNKAASLVDVNSVVGMSHSAEDLLGQLDATIETYGHVLKEGSSEDLKIKADREYLGLYRMNDEGTSLFYASAAAVLSNQDPQFNLTLQNLPNNYKSRFKNHVNNFVKKFKTSLENGDPQAFAMIDPEYAIAYEAYKRGDGSVTASQLRAKYNEAREIAQALPNLTIPEFFANNSITEKFPESTDIIGRRNYITEMVTNNDVTGLHAASRKVGISGEEELMLRYAAFQVSSGVSQSEVERGAQWWATTFSDSKLENTKLVNNLVEELKSDPEAYESEMFNMYRVYQVSGDSTMASAYLKGFKQLLDEAYVQNPGGSSKKIIAYTRDLEKKYLTRQGVYRSANGRDTFIPSSLNEHIDPNMNQGLLAGPTQLIKDKLSSDNGVRAVEAGVFVEVAKQMEAVIPRAIEQAILKSPQLIRELMPDLYDSMSEEEQAELLELQQKYASGAGGITALAPNMPAYSAIRNYLTEDKRREMARGLYFNTYRIGVKDVPIAKLEYTEENGVQGYRVRLLDVTTGKHTMYLEMDDKDKTKLFVPVENIKGSVNASKERHINVGIFRDRSEDGAFLQNPAVGMIRDIGASAFDTPFGLFMKDNRFMDATLNFHGIE
jgi:hypothetical protein